MQAWLEATTHVDIGTMRPKFVERATKQAVVFDKNSRNSVGVLFFPSQTEFRIGKKIDFFFKNFQGDNAGLQSRPLCTCAESRQSVLSSSTYATSTFNQDGELTRAQKQPRTKERTRSSAKLINNALWISLVGHRSTSFCL